MGSPKVSVIVPIYHTEAYLHQCIDSILSQTLHDIEIILVNDGSPDSSSAICEDYQKKDNRVIVITQENQGLSMARNVGAKHAKGEYVYFLDSDDSIHPQLLEMCYTLAEKEKADLVCFSFKHDTNFTPIDILTLSYKKTSKPLTFFRKRHTWKIGVNVWSKFYRKSLIKDLTFIPNIMVEDFPYVASVLLKHPKTVILREHVYCYRKRPGSLSSLTCSVKMLQDYHAGLIHIGELFESASRQERSFILRELFPNILKQQLNRILRSPQDRHPALYRAFAAELTDLRQRKYLKIWGHKWTRYLKYNQIIRKYS